MINCPNCGASNLDGSAFCANCGSRIEIAPENMNSNYSSGQQTGGYNPQPNPPYYPRQGDSRKNWAAVTGFIMGLLSVISGRNLFFLSIPGFIISIIGVKSEHRGISIAGIVLSSIVLAIILIVVVVYIMAIVTGISILDAIF